MDRKGVDGNRSMASGDRGMLNDDHDQVSDFRSSILKVDPAQFSLGTVDDLDSHDSESDSLRRGRQFGESVASRTSTNSTRSKVSLNPNMCTADQTAKNLFSSRANAIENAVEDCKASVVILATDGDVKGHWLLTEIDHWDLEKERLVLLTSKSLLLVKYDFIALKPSSCKRIPLNAVSHIEIGDFVYPRYSIMPPREHGGFRVHWSTGPVSTLQWWNPLSEDIGYITLTHHLLAYNNKGRDSATFDVSDLADAFIQAVGVVRQSERRTEPLRIENRPIMIESYASPASLVFNQGHVGFHMERGGVSF